MSDKTPEPKTPISRKRQIASAVVGLLLIYLVAAYVVAPQFWRGYVRRHPALDQTPGITLTAAGIPGDPINVGLVGTEGEIKQIMQAAKWDVADALSLRSDVKIAEATVLKREYDKAPVSNLYLKGRKEDLAFEQPFGPNPRQRHHVRFWRSDTLDADGRPFWAGAATFDKSVGLSHTTGQITHHIEADVDKERNHLFENLTSTGGLFRTDIVEGFHAVRNGRNGGGDPWTTDGSMYVGIITPNQSK